MAVGTDDRKRKRDDAAVLDDGRTHNIPGAGAVRGSDAPLGTPVAATKPSKVTIDSDSDSDNDDDAIGPRLPIAAAALSSTMTASTKPNTTAAPVTSSASEAGGVGEKPIRETWMLEPPSASELAWTSERAMASLTKSRKFQQHGGPRQSETARAEQAERDTARAEYEAAERQRAKAFEADRGMSLLDQHRAKQSAAKSERDARNTGHDRDRPFDRDRDMRGGGGGGGSNRQVDKLLSTVRREVGDKFGKSTYL